MRRLKSEISHESETLKENPLLSDITRTVQLSDIAKPLSDLIQSVEGIDAFDVLIKNKDDDIAAVVIDAAAYNFLLKKMDEAEDEYYQHQDYENYTGKEKTLEELLEDLKEEK